VKKSLFLLLVAFGAASALVSPDLENRLALTAPGTSLSVSVVLKAQFDPELLNSLVDGMPRAQRRLEVSRILSEFAAGEQAGLLELLAGNGARNIRPLWIVNAVSCEMTLELIKLVSARPEVAYVGSGSDPASDVLEEPGTTADPSDEIPWGVQRVNAPAVWALGHTGQGIVVGLIDTGTDYTHTDLEDHMWIDPNYPHHGWDFENSDNDPMDEMGHGTMTAGFISADGSAGSQCGVAPDAQLMLCRVRTAADPQAEVQCWEAMQFCVAPPLSPANGADVICLALGWRIAWNPQQATWRTVANNVNAAGLCQFASPGSEGSTNPPYDIRCPGHVPPPWWNPENSGTGELSGIVSVGATDSDDLIASFSSRGPTTWQAVAPFNDYAYPPGLTKPEVSAPGVNVKTTLLGGGYTVVSGTSWSTAVGAAAAAVLLSRDPDLSPAEVDEALELSAVDLGTPGKDNAYGAGRIDLLGAVTGFQEGRRPTACGPRPRAVPSVFRTECRVNAPGVEVLDASGRKVAVISGGIWRPDAMVQPGVYFLRSAASRKPTAVRVSYVR